MEIRRQITIVRAWFPLLVAGVLLAAGAAFVFSSLQEKIYEAKATLIVGQSLSSASPNYDQLMVSQRLSTTYASVATTRPILDSVVSQLRLKLTADELRGRVLADAQQNSTLLTITARDTDPARAADIANALADELIAASPAIQGRQAEFQASIDADLQATQTQIQAIQAQVEALSGEPDRTPQQDAQIQTLEGRLVTLRSTYATLLSFSSSNAPNLLSIVEPAVSPSSPVSPRPLFYTLLAAIVGLLLAAAIAFVAEYLDDAVKRPEDVREVVDLPVLGTIAQMKHERGRSEIYQLAALLYPRSGVAEAYRTLRTNIEFASVDAPISTLLVTSSVPGEGKSITAANLAAVFAQAGRRVLLIDADLRMPGVHRIFDVPNAQGLTTLLRSDEVNADSVIQGTEQANLRILTTGPLPPNPAELLGSQRARTVLDRLKAGADVLIFDSPPIQTVADAAILSSFVDGTILVIDAGHTHRGAIRDGREALARAGANVIGVVLNRIADRHQSDVGYYGGYHEPVPEAVAVADARPTPGA